MSKKSRSTGAAAVKTRKAGKKGSFVEGRQRLSQEQIKNMKAANKARKKKK